MKIHMTSSAIQLSPKAAKWFLSSIGFYYLFFIYYTFVYMWDTLTDLSHPDFPDLKGDINRCISVWTIVLHAIFYFSINTNNTLTFFLTKDDSFIKNVVLPYEKFLEKCFLGIVFPLTWSVCSVFWCVYFLEREAIFPLIMEDIVPVWYNHCIHTVPAVIVTLHLILVKQKFKPLSMKTCMEVQSSLHALYSIVLIFYRHKHGYWLYDFLETRTTTMLETLQYFAFYILVIPNILVWLGYMLFNKVK